ncbi:MAG: type II/IV secretion system protein [Candidatus Kerfeldbacteria bacterium]|nr:type II/IV secretion system protein [Candidatus Kerfeldbacteria bacterium]
MALDQEQLKRELLAAELITEDQFSSAVARAREHHTSVEQELVEAELVSDENLGQIIADLYSVPYVNVTTKQIPDSVLRVIPELVAKRQRLLAFEQTGDGLKVAMVDPTNEELKYFIEKKTGHRVIPHYTTVRNINDALKFYRKELTEAFDDIIQHNVAAAQGTPAANRELPITRIVDTILHYAYENKASDVHIEPHEESVVIRFRIDGILHDVVTLPKELHAFIITRIKIMAKLRTDEHRAAQDGRLDFPTEDEQVDVRVSVIPVSDGEKVVMRLLTEKSRQFSLVELGMNESDMRKLELTVRRPHGMILATGPTGSGKTTTLYALLKILNTREVNISTIEDPVEYDIDGVNQIQVDSKTNLTFALGLRSILRQDPDIVMVGEIRDEETASIAINAAMTGHLVLSTLHTNDAPTTLPRLLDMKIEPFLIASTVNVALAQRLVRKIHRGCIESYTPDSVELSRYASLLGEARAQAIGFSEKGFRLYRGKGCALCNNTGFEGRVGIFEVLEMTERIRQLIMQRANSDVIRQAAIAEGMSTMLDDGLEKAKRGITTVDEVLRAANT